MPMTSIRTSTGRGATLAWLLLLGGCAVGPDYVRPAATRDAIYTF